VNGRPARALVFALITLTLGCVAKAQTSPYAQWAVVVAAGDDRAAHEDVPTLAFDNARRDVATALIRRGFSPANIAQFSLDPLNFPDAPSEATSLKAIGARLNELSKTASAGCLVYVTSHGSPDGVVTGETLTAPDELARVVGGACGDRPTAVIVSACFSGVFVPALAGPNRFVLTAARRDRSSFGCSESDRYPFFDACIIESLPVAADFADLADRARICVNHKEIEARMRPASMPQLRIGERFRALAQRFAPPGG